jgi:hypothetical protein
MRRIIVLMLLALLCSAATVMAWGYNYVAPDQFK